MESSKRAVEAYKRTRLVDHVITDDDKVAPIYRLDEICDMLRTSSSDMVREVVEYTMKRLDSRSPRVKQKTLRMIKYAVVKGGPEFKRQMQRQAAAVRQLFEYKGQPDVLRGDALNKAVRDTAHEAITAIFASDDKPSQVEEVNKRIMGFGSTHHEMHTVADAKKPTITNVMSEVLEFGSASIKQGLTIISGYSGGNMGNMRNDSGSYRGPSLRKSLTSERGTLERFEHDEGGDSRTVPESSGPPVYISRASQQEVSVSRAETDSTRGVSSLEERLLDTITAPGGMRLQPTRESLQKFLADVAKLNNKNLCIGLETKLHSPAWQIRFKALCVLEAIVRQRDQEFFGAVVDYFKEDAGVIHDCLQLPQTTLKDKALKILDQLGPSSKDYSEKNGEGLADFGDGPQPSIVHDMPDLIDTGDSDLLAGENSSPQCPSGKDDNLNVSVTAGDLLGEGLWVGDSEASGPEDVFAGLSFHTPDRVADESSDGLFSGLSLNKSSSEGGFDHLLNGLREEKEKPGTVNASSPSESLVDLMGSVDLKDPKKDSRLFENGFAISQSPSVQNIYPGNALSSQMFGNMVNPQVAHLNHAQMAHLSTSVPLPMGMAGNYRVPFMIPPNFGAGVRGNLLYQQQLPSGMAGLQGLHMGMGVMNGGNSQGLSGTGRVFGDNFDFSGDASSRSPTVVDSRKREETKAFDFISDHVSAARGPKKPF